MSADRPTLRSDSAQTAVPAKRGPAAVRGVQQAIGQRWRDRQRKKAARGRRRGASRALLLLLAILLGLFFWSLHAIFTAGHTGTKLGLDEVTALAAEHRVASATLRDVDNRVVGTFVPGPVPSASCARVGAGSAAARRM